MNVFLTGCTGFLGGELLVNLSLRKDIDKIYCLIRAKSFEDAQFRLKHVFELHNDLYDENKIIPVLGNLIDANFHEELKKNKSLNDTNIIVHSAANTSFSKIYDKLVENVNINGLTKVLLWAKDLPNLQTFVYVGTATICGKDIKNRMVYEDESPNLKANHLVKYTYTKMKGEILVNEHLPKEKILIVRPSVVMGDSRPIIPRSTVILWALATFNQLRMVPVGTTSSIDIISVDYCARAIVKILFAANRKHHVYHISSGSVGGTDSLKLFKSVEPYFNNRPSFSFVERSMYNEIKLWAKNKLSPKSPLHNYDEFLTYWSRVFEDNARMRILLIGLEPYIDFIEMGQLFDNSRLLEDSGIEPPPPVHEYIKNSIEVLGNIDIYEGAIDP
jgi:thioester reductase-like protein